MEHTCPKEEDPPGRLLIDREDHLNSPSTSRFHEMQPISYQPPYNHQHHPSAGHPQFQQQPPLYHPPNGMTDTQFRVASWQQPYDSGVHSLQQSQAPSIMSIQSSCMSSMADPADLTEVQRQHFEHITHSLRGAAPQALRELLTLLNDDNDAVVMKALGILLNVAKRDADDKFSVSVVITSSDVVVALANVLRERHEQLEMVRAVLITLFYISLRNQATLVIEANETVDGDLLRRVVSFSRNRCVHKYAIPIVHSLLTISDKQKKARNIQVAIQEDLLDAMMQFLNDDTTTEKLQSIVVDLITIICTRNNEQANIFLNRNGVRRLVDILNKSSYDGLLSRTTKLLTKLPPSAGSLLIESNVPLAVSEKLTHASPQLVKDSVVCLRCLSHFQTMQHQSKVIAKVMQLLGPTSDVQLLQYAVDILYNMCVQNSTNKTQVSRGSAVQHLLELLMYPAEMSVREQLEESILGLLSILCKDHQLAHNTQANVVTRIPIILQKLKCMRPKIVRVALQLLSRVACQSNLLPTLSHAYLDNDYSSGVVGRVMEILRVSCGSLGSQPIVEEVRISTLMTLCFEILRLLTKEKRVMLPQVLQFVQYRDGTMTLLPIFALQQTFVDDKHMKKAALELIDTLVSEPEMAELFAVEEYFSCLQNYQHADRELAQLSRHACEMIMLGGALPMSPPRAMPARATSPMDDGGDVLPEDLSNLELNDNPFADVFMPTTHPPHNTPPFSPVHQQRPSRYEPQYYSDSSTTYHQMPPHAHYQYGENMYNEYPHDPNYRPPNGPYPPPAYNYPYYPNYPPQTQRRDYDDRVT